jgi:hypothetical protein
MPGPRLSALPMGAFIDSEDDSEPATPGVNEAPIPAF